MGALAGGGEFAAAFLAGAGDLAFLDREEAGGGVGGRVTEGVLAYGVRGQDVLDEHAVAQLLGRRR
ncbi:hypothetical protein [Streptomyces noursei]|uniref:hypothetical protein n=1 Tax=Streptomyces noursei TaxID=1971 RepID=UPI0011DE1FF9|nr:hypothetical protein [Streptomyces noursei]